MKSGDSTIVGKGLLIGRYASTIGAKGRVAVPVKLREQLGEKVIISQGYEKSLLLVSLSRWEKLTEFLRDKPLTVGPVRDTERFYSEARLRRSLTTRAGWWCRRSCGSLPD